MIAPNAWKARKMNIDSLKHFTLPGEGFIKMNFDRASKGNLWTIGLGGIFRDNQANTQIIYAKSGGIASNNEAEFVAVGQGLKIAIRLVYKHVEVEGDSSLFINTMRKLNNGTPWDKLSQSWRTSRLIQEIGELIHKFNYLVIRHVRREGNKAAYFLANWGCNQQHGPMERVWPMQPKDDRLKPLEDILQQDTQNG